MSISDTEKVLFSIVVPVFNGAGQIRRTMASLLQDTHISIEIIVVNDGSTDSTENIVKLMTESDERIRYFYQKNQGPSAARNYGLQQTRGAYVLFVDSDDEIVAGALEALSTIIETHQSDLIAFNFRPTFGTRADITSGVFPATGVYSSLSCLSLLYRGNIDNFVWSYCFSASIFDRIHFPYGINMMEDAVVMNEVFRNIDSVYILNDVLYLYDVREGSLSRSMSRWKVEQGFQALSTIGTLPVPENDRLSFIRYMTKMYMFLIHSLEYKKSNKKLGKEIIRNILTLNKEVSVIREYGLKMFIKILLMRFLYL